MNVHIMNCDSNFDDSSDSEKLPSTTPAPNVLEMVALITLPETGSMR